MVDDRDALSRFVRSAIHAALAPEARPIPRPVSARPTNSHAVSDANRNTSIAAIAVPTAGKAVGRRPI
jgi:hypothetical protein